MCRAAGDGELNNNRQLARAGYPLGVSEALSHEFAFEAMKNVADVLARIAELSRLSISSFLEVWKLRDRIDAVERDAAETGEEMAARFRYGLEHEARLVGGASAADRRFLLEVSEQLHALSERTRLLVDADMRFLWRESPLAARRRAAWRDATAVILEAEASLRRAEADPIMRSLGDAPDDDELLSESEIAALDEARQDMREGSTISTADLRRRLGLDA